jgi:hypothetical protein
MDRENLSEFVHFISNHCYINSTIKAYLGVTVSMEMIERSKVTFVTDRHLRLLLLLNYQDNQVITFNSAAY